ncbi:class I SAM-dependent methyltransferase [Paraferrimonas sp. SM1919]|uniref:class I SAM-dependent methyltransferase n=1 Tax=Paraferrimonas sp. SM1919 TaxID=2662263 RepID=UPI0013D24DE2|nr:class I SAM-dependent methyltransferase [Paraferrimonas sp. SM1919]
MSNHWDNYWQAGNFHSFSQDYKDNYEGVLFEFWKNIFKQAPCAAAILDIASGNGAIAELALNFCDLPKSIIACDLAKLQPKPTLLDKIEFHSQVNCEKLPYPDLKFDCITSSFGIEYANLDLALDEVYRVLKSHGKAHFIIHHQGSTLINLNQSILTTINAMFELDLFNKATAALVEFNPKSVAFKQFNSVMNALVKLNGEGFDNSGIGQCFAGLIQSNLNSNQKQKLIQQWQQEFQASQARLLEMMNAAKSAEQLDSILSSKPYCSSYSEVICPDNGLLAWQLQIN